MLVELFAAAGDRLTLLAGRGRGRGVPGHRAAAHVGAPPRPAARLRHARGLRGAHVARVHRRRGRRRCRDRTPVAAGDPALPRRRSIRRRGRGRRDGLRDARRRRRCARSATRSRCTPGATPTRCLPAGATAAYVRHAGGRRPGAAPRATCSSSSAARRRRAPPPRRAPRPRDPGRAQRPARGRRRPCSSCTGRGDDALRVPLPGRDARGRRPAARRGRRRAGQRRARRARRDAARAGRSSRRRCRTTGPTARGSRGAGAGLGRRDRRRPRRERDGGAASRPAARAARRSRSTTRRGPGRRGPTCWPAGASTRTSSSSRSPRSGRGCASATGRRGGDRRPSSRGSAHVRVGGGPEGNVGPDVLTRLLATPAGPPPGGGRGGQEPAAAIGGAEPEPLEAVQQLAPHAFRTQLRAVTPADYAAVAGCASGRAAGRRAAPLDRLLVRAGGHGRPRRRARRRRVRGATRSRALLDVRRMAGRRRRARRRRSPCRWRSCSASASPPATRAPTSRGQLRRELSAARAARTAARLLPPRPLHLRPVAVRCPTSSRR